MPVHVRELALCTVFVALIGLANPYLRAQQRGPSTQDERTRAVKVANALQMDPLSPDVQQDREWLLKWLIEVPDISAPLCGGLLGDLGDNGSGYPGALTATEAASEAAFAIEHPDNAKDHPSLYLAGADGALNAYQAIRMKDPKFRLKQLDDMLKTRDQGKLGDYVASKKCR